MRFRNTMAVVLLGMLITSPLTAQDRPERAERQERVERIVRPEVRSRDGVKITKEQAAVIRKRMETTKEVSIRSRGTDTRIMKTRRAYVANRNAMTRKLTAQRRAQLIKRIKAHIAAEKKAWTKQNKKHETNKTRGHPRNK